MFLSTPSQWHMGDVPWFPAIARAGQFWAVAKGANFPHGPVVRSSSSAVSPFTSRTSRSYSGSAAALNEEATKAAFSSPPRRRVVSPVAYRLDLPTVRRRRASPVMHQDRFLQAVACNTLKGPRSAIRSADRGTSKRALVSASFQGRCLAHPQGHDCHLPESPCLAPSSYRLLRFPRWRYAGCLPPSKLRSASKVFCTDAVPHR
jgi:hypothetical protein